MRKRIKIILLIIFISFLFHGCVFLNLNKAIADEKGHFIYHYSSCGPESISRALSLVDPNNVLYPAEVSASIQETGNFVRIFLSLISYKSLGITWPHEIRAFFEKRGYEVIEMSNIKDLDVNKDIAVILVSNSILNMHWFCYPSELYVLDSEFLNGSIRYIFKIKKITNNQPELNS